MVVIPITPAEATSPEITINGVIDAGERDGALSIPVYRKLGNSQAI